MDKTLSIIFVATVLLITAVTLTVFFTTSLEDTTGDLDTLKENEGPSWLSYDTEFSDNIQPVTENDISNKGETAWIRL